MTPRTSRIKRVGVSHQRRHKNVTYQYSRSVQTEVYLASRASRFEAYLMDCFLVLVISLFGGLLTGIPLIIGDRRMDLTDIIWPLGLIAFILSIVAIAALLSVQVIKLGRHGQTIGMQYNGIRVVRVSEINNGGITTNVLKREVIPALITVIPYLGIIFKIVNVLFVFRSDLRCIHDHIAGTIVIETDKRKLMDIVRSL